MSVGRSVRLSVPKELNFWEQNSIRNMKLYHLKDKYASRLPWRIWCPNPVWLVLLQYVPPPSAIFAAFIPFLNSFFFFLLFLGYLFSLDHEFCAFSNSIALSPSLSLSISISLYLSLSLSFSPSFSLSVFLSFSPSFSSSDCLRASERREPR